MRAHIIGAYFSNSDISAGKINDLYDTLGKIDKFSKIMVKLIASSRIGKASKTDQQPGNIDNIID
jgi:hypothetical protein